MSRRTEESLKILKMEWNKTATRSPSLSLSQKASAPKKVRESQCHFTWMIFPHDFPIFVLDFFFVDQNSFWMPPACQHATTYDTTAGRTLDDNTRNVIKIDSTSMARMWCVRGYFDCCCCWARLLTADNNDNKYENVVDVFCVRENYILERIKGVEKTYLHANPKWLLCRSRSFKGMPTTSQK